MKIDTGFIIISLMTIVNVYWTWQGKKVQNDRDIIKSLQFKLQEKDEIIKDILRKKNELKMQYAHQVNLTKKLEGELKTYRQFNNHPIV